MTPDWRDEAACAEVDPEIFFPTRGDDNDEARYFCRRCWVAPDCLALAMRAEGSLPPRMRFGIWGGTTPLHRARLYARARASQEKRRTA